MYPYVEKSSASEGLCVKVEPHWEHGINALEGYIMCCIVTAERSEVWSVNGYGL